MKRAFPKSGRVLALFAGIGFGFLCGLIVARAAYNAPQRQTVSASIQNAPPALVKLPAAASQASIAMPATEESIDTKEKSAGKGDSTPKLSELSQSALDLLDLSCLGTDLVVDPVLAELSNLNPAQLTFLQNTILEHQRQWSEAEAERCIAIQDQNMAGVIIPPLPESASQAEANLKNRVESIVGEDRMAVVWRSLAEGLRQATGDFGRIPRMITFEQNPRSEANPYRVRVSVFEDDEDKYMDDWTKITTKRARMNSYEFRELPPQFEAFADQIPEKLPIRILK